MKEPTIAECDLHPGQKLHKFCKSLSCWAQVCSKCITKSHSGHQIIEYKSLQQETKNAKEILIQSKKGDLLSVKRILSSVVSLQERLEGTQEKRREERRQAEQQFMARIETAEKEDKASCEELSQGIQKYLQQLNDYYNVQALEVEKIPSLADAVLTKGTIDDLKTFFEMCKEGSENHAEISQYKNTCDVMKKNVEEYIVQKPFSFESQANKSFLDSSKGDISSFNIPEFSSFTNEQHFLDVSDKLFSPIEAPKTKTKKPVKSGVAQISSAQPRKLMGRTNSTASLSNYKSHRNSLLSESLISTKSNRTTAPKNCMPSKPPKKPAARPRLPVKAPVPSRNAQPGKLKTTEVKKPPVKKEVKKSEVGRAKVSAGSRRAKSKPERLESVKMIVGEVKSSLKAVSKELNEKLKKLISKIIDLTCIGEFGRKVKEVGHEKTIECKLYMMNFAEGVVEFMLKNRIEEQKALCT
eukprot:TRINITY_DN3890_c0_g1_i2.p1 TRINITY_DN3890_c0_g1~~TRINITY_DN3890_c0_g1_i2.p1  ORF type:complete len:504 (-),score=153.78 TRINITY_DN3890_c0_g1_i2:564-1967(-)